MFALPYHYNQKLGTVGKCVIAVSVLHSNLMRSEIKYSFLFDQSEHDFVNNLGT